MRHTRAAGHQHRAHSCRFRLRIRHIPEDDRQTIGSGSSRRRGHRCAGPHVSTGLHRFRPTHATLHDTHRPTARSSPSSLARWKQPHGEVTSARRRPIPCELAYRVVCGPVNIAVPTSSTSTSGKQMRRAIDSWTASHAARLGSPTRRCSRVGGSDGTFHISFHLGSSPSQARTRRPGSVCVPVAARVDQRKRFSERRERADDGPSRRRPPNPLRAQEPVGKVRSGIDLEAVTIALGTLAFRSLRPQSSRDPHFACAR